jgi:4-carboxymuconolactone decarboxylase
MKVEMRLPYLKPEEMNKEQKEFYDFHLESMKPMPYCWITEEGELNGPSNVMLHNEKIGNMLFPLNRAIIGNSIEMVGGEIHEIAILAVVASAKAQYGIYAHTKLAQKFGVSDDKIASITAGEKPVNLTEEEGIAYDLAVSLCQSGAISGIVYKRAVEAFGEKGVAALVFTIGMFKMIGTILNAYNEPVPENL